MARMVKVVWQEARTTRAVYGFPDGEEGGFLRFELADGRVLRLNKASIVKIEDKGGGAE